MIQILVELPLSCRQEDVLGSRVDAPQKPNCRSGCDSENGSALVYQVSEVLLYLTSRKGKLHAADEETGN
jgi:hypothetical protein